MRRLTKMTRSNRGKALRKWVASPHLSDGERDSGQEKKEKKEKRWNIAHISLVTIAMAAVSMTEQFVQK